MVTGGDERLCAHVRPPAWRNPDPAPLYDLVVLGGGTAGLVSAVGAAGLGARVALVERSLLGGDCLNSGCVPSKALLRASRAVHEARTAGATGVRVTHQVDFAAVMESVRARRVDLAPHDSARRLASLGVDVFFGEASFTGRRAVSVDGRVLAFRRAIVATGGRPAVPAIAGLDRTPYFTSEGLFTLTGQPRTLLVVGAGPTGCEMAQALALLGTSVTLVQAESRVLPREDPDASAVLAGRLAADGVRIATGATIASVAAAGAQVVARVRDAAGSEAETLVADAVLVATGRSPNVQDLDLEAAGVDHDAAGVTVDEWLRTSNPAIYAAGDVCFPYKFTHAADATARIAVQNALFPLRRRASALVIPWCIYTFPEVAHVGPTPDEARRRGAERVTVPLSAVDRAVIDAETDGFLRLHHRRGRIVAGTIVAPRAGELIGYIASHIRRGGTLAGLSSEIHPYPTLAEAFRKAGDEHRRVRVGPWTRTALRRYFALMRRF